LSPFAPLDSLITPRPTQDRISFLCTRPYAHRGLHDKNIPENSRAAFLAAIAAGHGIELDVQSAREGEAFVFHDERLDRLTDIRGFISQTDAVTLDHTALRGTTEMIPRLAEILALIDGRTPVLIEVKSPETKVGVLCLSVRRALEGYQGPVAVMSFNPAVIHWFAEHAPRFTRGLVISETEDIGRFHAIRFRLARRIALWRARPDFLAYDVRSLPSRFAREQRKRGLPILTWTIRTATEERIALANADEIIYEKPDARRI
jgi:glycerophosphoryl diester phosphodiesterase